MTSHPSLRPVSALRARMIEDMRVRGFAEKTRNDHVSPCAGLRGLSSAGRPTTATAEDLRRFQLHQTQIGMQPPSVNSAVAAQRSFFTVTLDAEIADKFLTIYHFGCCTPPAVPLFLREILFVGAAGLSRPSESKHMSNSRASWVFASGWLLIAATLFVSDVRAAAPPGRRQSQQNPAAEVKRASPNCKY
jgi:hypothetical protein